MRRSKFFVMGYGLIIAVAGLIITVFCAQLLKRMNDQHAVEALSKATHQTADAVIARLLLYQYGLRGVSGAVLTTGEDQITTAIFRRYSETRDIQSEFPGARGFGFIRRVAQKDEQAFVAKMREDGNSSYALRQFSPHQGERFLIQFIEPQLTNSIALGLDLASNTPQREAAMAALQSGHVKITAPITLVQAKDQPQQAFLILLPLYRGIKVPATQDEREQQGIGWSYAPLSSDQVLRELGFQSDALHLRLSDVTDAENTTRFFDSRHETDNPPEVMSDVIEKNVLGRRWRFEVSAHPLFIENLRQVPPYFVVFIGAILTLLVIALVRSLDVSRRRKLQIISEKARLASIVESSTDAIITETFDRIVTSWNLGAQELFGYTAGEAIGQCLSDLIAVKKPSYEEEHFLKQVWEGRRIASFNAQRRQKDGTIVDVSISIAPIYEESGKVIGASKTVRDITSEKQSEALILDLNASLERQVAQRTSQLQELNTLFSSVLRSASLVSIIATDLNGLIMLFNEGARRLLGYEPDEIVGLHTPEILHIPEELLERSKELARAHDDFLEGFHVLTHVPQIRGAETREWTYIRKDGSRFPVTLHVTAMRRDDGTNCGFLYIAIDISVRKEAELRLAERVETTRAILDTAINPVLSINIQGMVQSFNVAGERVFGYTKKEMRGRNVLSLISKDTQSIFAEYINEFVNGADRSNLENHVFQGKKKDNSTFPFQMSVGVMQLEGERMLVCIITDISQQQQQQAELLATRDQLLLAAEVAELGIWSWRLQDNSLTWNARMFELYAHSLDPKMEELNFEHWRSRVHPEDVNGVTELLNGALKGTDNFDTSFRVLRPDGSLSYVQASARVERASCGRPIGVTGINRDITAQHDLEARLLDAKEQADAASAAKSFFLANMSHEIRTPMNAVLGMLQLIQNTGLSDRQLDYVDKAQIAAKSLLGLLNDILDYSKIEAGKLQLDLHKFELEPLMRDLAVVLAGNQNRHDVEVMFELDTDLPSCLIGDSLRLQQVLINLAGNALKFTTSGQVLVSVERLTRENEKVTVRFTIEDSGIGISAEQIQRIFEGFTQAEASTSRRFGGTGLGLVICKRLITLMGGDLQVESTEGVGSRFWFDIPLDAARATPLRSNCPGVDSPVNVLVVDDNSLAGAILCRTASSLGWSPELVVSGKLAIQRVIDAQLQGTPYDVVLMDWKMPEMDGLSAATQIRVGDQNAPPLIIMITAYGREILANVHQEGSAPFAAFLTKPVTPKQLADAVNNAFHQGDSPAQVRSPIPMRSNRLFGMRILVVEDNGLNRQVAQELLSYEGATVELAEGGLEGVCLVVEGQQSFDVILMDIQMPDIDGMEATRRIRSQPRFTRLPIVAMTANASNADRAACLEAGMNEHVGKPIDIDTLVNTLLDVTTKRSLYMVKVFPLKPQEVPLTESRKVILDRFSGQLDLIRNMLNKAEPELSALIEGLEYAATCHNLTVVAGILHSFRGSAATLGAKRLASMTSSLESKIKNATQSQLSEFFSHRTWILELRDVLNSSCIKLLAMFKDDDATPSVVSLEAYPMAQWRDALDGILVLLEQGNLQVIEDADQLQSKTPFTLRPQFKEFLDAVHSLDFVKAIRLGKSLLESS